MKKKTQMETMELANLMENSILSVDEAANSIRFYEELGGMLLIEMGRKNMTVDMLADFSCVNRNTVYKTLRGTMHPEKDTILRWAFVLEMTVENAQRMLKTASVGALSAHVRRELYLLNGLAKHYDLERMNRLLIDNGFKPLLK